MDYSFLKKKHASSLARYTFYTWNSDTRKQIINHLEVKKGNIYRLLHDSTFYLKLRSVLQYPSFVDLLGKC